MLVIITFSQTWWSHVRDMVKAYLCLKYFLFMRTLENLVLVMILDMSRYCPDTDMSSHCVDTWRHCLDMQIQQYCLETCRHCLDMTRHIQTYLEMSKHCVDTSTHCPYTARHYLDTLITGVENGLERQKLYTFYIMILKGMFLYVIRTCISTKAVTLICKLFLYWFLQNINNRGMDYVLSCVMCVWNLNSIFQAIQVCHKSFAPVCYCNGGNKYIFNWGCIHSFVHMPWPSNQGNYDIRDIIKRLGHMPSTQSEFRPGSDHNPVLGIEILR